MDTLDESVVHLIYSWGYPEEMCQFREVCKVFRDCIPAPTKFTANALLLEAAQCGQIGRCVIAKNHGAFDFIEMMLCAAEYGQMETCLLAKKWCEESDAFRYCHWCPSHFDWMACIAAKKRRIEFCVLAREWATCQGNRCSCDKSMSYNFILGGAAEGGSRELCELIKSWHDDPSNELSEYDRRRIDNGYGDFDDMLFGAIRGGFAEFCILAREWGARDIKKMAMITAANGNIELFVLAKSWINEAGDFSPKYAKNGSILDELLSVAAKKDDNEIICTLIKEWAQELGNRILPLNFNNMLCGNLKTCILARKWIRGKVDYKLMFRESKRLCRFARDWLIEDKIAYEDCIICFNSMLLSATYDGNKELVLLAREWGANDFNGMLFNAVESERSDMHALAIEWSGNNDLRESFVAACHSKNCSPALFVMRLYCQSLPADCLADAPTSETLRRLAISDADDKMDSLYSRFGYSNYGRKDDVDLPSMIIQFACCYELKNNGDIINFLLACEKKLHHFGGSSQFAVVASPNFERTARANDATIDHVCDIVEDFTMLYR
ncbi:MAG: hypothetical protein M0R33_15320 [Methylomonas sp.]|jgi:hypothetical protein|uniref:hypothetical protein n=1 Tax=Methylomonas sp. TaxID=418 RepID=UPI0025EBE1D9|nr:hypothetical protein [Methylomonas sp.]MCK9607812.1 hypothetical protein [Methylomonas sp.]